MSTSAIALQREIILDAVRTTARGQWKIMVVDVGSQRLIEGCVKEDDILKENITNIEYIEDRRPINHDVDAVYLLTPLAHIVDCLMADFQRRLYRHTFVIWTSLLPQDCRAQIEQSAIAQEQLGGMRMLNINYHPQESHLIVFRDPWSFPILFHPACNSLVRMHMSDLAERIVSVCVSLGEYPIIRYYNPHSPSHEASVLCSHLARFVQLELDQYAKYHEDFPPVSPRPRGTLIITDRTMDLFAPLVHEFTYQAMVHDVLSLRSGDKVFYRTALNPNDEGSTAKDIEISENDKLWVNNRHLHMKELLEKLAMEFQIFKSNNPQFSGKDDPSSLNNIKDMLAGLPQYQEGKEAFSLHLNMASDAMNVFQHRKLGDIASVEQLLSTGLDEDHRKPRNVADQVIRLLDESDVAFSDRLRLIIQYALYRDGLIVSDCQKLLAHAQLPPEDEEVIRNIDLLGANISRSLQTSKARPLPLFGTRQASASPANDGSSLSRYKPAVKEMLEACIGGTLDQVSFPCTKPRLDAGDESNVHDNVSQASLRSAKPTWARTRPSARDPKQRIIVFIAGGATYSESRACCEVSHESNKEIFLASSHMLTPHLFLRQVGDLSVDRTKLSLPADQPKSQAPAHLLERDLPAVPTPYPNDRPQAVPPVSSMNLHSHPSQFDRLHLPDGGTPSLASPLAPVPKTANDDASGRRDRIKDGEKKKKHHFFSYKK